MKGSKPYRLIGAYDSETTNIHTPTSAKAFPILHQLGLIDAPIESLNADNVEQHTNIELYRHTYQLAARLDDLAAQRHDYVPVIACHNLAFDMWPLADWLNAHNTRVLAKSRQKPLTFTICDDRGNPQLVIWDSLQFSGKPLAKMGAECGYLKAVGDWNYNLIRTPETPLTADELNYSRRDIYALLAWFGWYLERNPDISPDRLALNVVTKTGVVRERMRIRYDAVKGNGCRYNVGRFWYFHNKKELPTTDDGLFTMHACTRGGLTFCASRFANVPFAFDDSRVIAGFDAVSMHPAQMSCHRYPVQFRPASEKLLDTDFRIVAKTPLSYVLSNWAKPFPRAFIACFHVTNIRPKPGTVFVRDGVLPLASARFSHSHYELNEDNESGQRFTAHIEACGYTDSAERPEYAFGKLIRADSADLWLTELEAWIMCQCYEFDTCSALHGYETGRFARPTDMSLLAVMGFYKAKNIYKRARAEYRAAGTIDARTADDLASAGVAPVIIEGMRAGTLSDSDLDAGYQSVKADLNSLFGTQATNEFRQDTELTRSGIEYAGAIGIECGPKNPKAWYEFGQRIVGWSRVAQVVTMMLAAPYVDGIVNGDTDSVKYLTDRERLPQLEAALSVYADAIDNAKADVMTRVKRAYPSLYDPLDGIGYYECEFTSDRFCAAWNKAYCTYDIDPRDGLRHFDFTLAGIPAGRGLNEFADKLADQGRTFGEITDLLLGYDVALAYDMIRLNARSFPEWGAVYHDEVTDYIGNTACVTEPCALALYPMSKLVNSTDVAANRANLAYAQRNRPTVNTRPALLTWGEGRAPMIVRYEDE